MIVNYSKSFEKSVNKLSGKLLESVLVVIKEVKNAGSVDEIKDCKKLADFDNAYRIRIGGLRAFFTVHMYIDGNVVIFEYLTSRGQAYKKGILRNCLNL